MKRAYFAHPISDYDTAFEREVEAWLSTLGCTIENPNQTHHQEGYARKGMAYFTEDVLPGCQLCFYLPFPGGWVGAGVAMEVEWFLACGATVWRVDYQQGTGGVDYFSLAPCVGMTPEGWRASETILSRDETRGASRVLKSIGGGRWV